ncbi:HDOD domain-containing protein [Aromatoleum bremense]|nr:HDOD domain-containing protein [Aromatoleum bremense]QTQ33757.1 Metal-dependent hydrolase HDOD domain-containing protein [Aromatoleum bremense]
MIKGLMERGLKLPPQPRVVDELQKCQRRQERNVRVVARIISQDAGITAMLFRAVESPVYRHHRPFVSVEKIVQALGIDQVVNIVQAIALATAGNARTHRKIYERFWANSTAIAQLAMLVAEDLVSVCNIFPDQAYLAGVFHDCGVPLLMERFPTYCQAAAPLDQQATWFGLTDEDRKYQTDHAVVGYFVAKHWKLPDFICDAIRFHHDLLRLEDHSARTMVAILQMAFHLYCRSLYIENPEWPHTSATVLYELGMDEITAQEFMDEMLDRYNAVQ